MNTKTTANHRASILLPDILMAYNSSEDDHELLNSEEFLHNVEQVNKKITDGEINSDELSIGSLDVENLYGSIDTKTACNVIREKIINSPLKFEKIDWRWAVIYLALTLKPVEIVDQKLQQVLPRKLNNRKATIKTIKDEETKERWHYPTPINKLDPSQKKQFLHQS